MTDFSLEIQIDQAGSQTISNTGMSVALLQPQDTADYQIVALLTSAVGTIYISWTDSISVYTSSYGLQAYEVLQINSQAPALSGQTFTFDGSTINQTGTTSLPDTIQLTNSSDSTVTSGLARGFNINGQLQPPAITTASSVLNNGQGSFQINNEIMLTLLGGVQLGMAIPSQIIPDFQSQSQHERNTSQITAQPPLILDFNTSSATQFVHFDDQNNMFVVGSLPS
ncbi:hypothetical protein DUT91_17100 [Phyllobacterium salinisoli]|uniref:Uncharacterized protein n=1 Tax=Phyllobacterium salinisoli TaxID=1899321 RepID=A0A368K050_9HYPH|nr:hypothetical protein [Phyllobacterium salinisoli]RCS22601.1 hypothetical protein DUT91_17100 [Phyllobacterium salinisoli]